MGRPRTAPVPAADADPVRDARFVEALARGLGVLQCFRHDERWLTHGELTRRCGLPPSTVSRLTYTLVQLGYLRHRPADGTYALSSALLGLGFKVLGTFEIGKLARPAMQRLSDTCRAAVSLGVRHELSMVYVAHCRSTARLSLGLDVGTRLPLASTAMGRAYLCAVLPAERDALCERLRAADAKAWPALQRGLKTARQQWQAQGFVTSEGEWETDIAAAGVALDIGDNRAPLSLTVGGPATHLKGEFLHQTVGPLLVQAAQQISATIRAAPWDD